MRLPSNGSVSQGFHSAHLAVDIVAGYRRPIVAPEAGVVSYSGQMGSGTNDAGLVVQIGDETNGHRLCHLESYVVSRGQRVAEGQLVGYEGYTGYTKPDNVIQGSHLHWVMWRNGQRVDGRRYVNQTQGDKPMTPDEEREAYRIVLERDMEHGGSGRTGIAFMRIAVPELNNKRQALSQHVANLENELRIASGRALANETAMTQLRAELTAANNKPAHEVIKEVEKIVEKCNVAIDETTEPPKPAEPNWFVKFLALLLKRKA